MQLDQIYKHSRAFAQNNPKAQRVIDATGYACNAGLIAAALIGVIHWGFGVFSCCILSLHWLMRISRS
jgi:hypothetical protein